MSADKVKKVWVVATQRGQNPDSMAWVDENALPFEIDETKVSKRWMKVIKASEAKALLAGAEPSEADDGDAGNSDEVDGLKKQVADLTEERDKMDAAGKDLTQQVADLTAANTALKEQLDEATKPPDTKQPDKSGA